MGREGVWKRVEGRVRMRRERDVACAHTRARMSGVIQQARRGSRRWGEGWVVCMWTRASAWRRVMRARERQDGVDGGGRGEGE